MAFRTRSGLISPRFKFGCAFTWSTKFLWWVWSEFMSHFPEFIIPLKTPYVKLSRFWGQGELMKRMKKKSWELTYYHSKFFNKNFHLFWFSNSNKMKIKIIKLRVMYIMVRVEIILASLGSNLYCPIFWRNTLLVIESMISLSSVI